jgi:hypothetical protein
MNINKIFRALGVALFALAGFATTNAENTAMSPYSRYGYGQLSNNATSAQRQMGGVGYAMNNGRQINVMNPASYAMCDSLTFLFDMGVDMTFLHSTDGDASANQNGGGLDYITMQFPINKYIGASVGLIPYSSVGYSFGSEIDNGTSTHSGSGGLAQLYGGLAVRPFKGFSVGVNFAYLFGNIVHDVYATTTSSTSTLFERTMNVKDWRMDIGLQYSLNLNPDNRVTLGLAYSPSKGLHGNTLGIMYDSSLSTIVPDTIADTTLKGKFSLPASYGGGLAYEWRQRLLLEADFTYQPWSKAKNTPIEDFETSEYTNYWRAAFGMQYTPDPRGSYVKRIQYRAGTYYNNDYVMVLGNKVRSYGISAGFGLPVPGYKTVISLGFDYRHRQANPNPLIKENYFNITLGINFNEMWFRKSKIY